MCKDCYKYPKLKKGRDFDKVARNRAKTDPDCTVNYNGKHPTVRINGHSISYPVHPKDYGKGIRHQLIKAFISAGLLGIFLLIIL